MPVMYRSPSAARRSVRKVIASAEKGCPRSLRAATSRLRPASVPVRIFPPFGNPIRLSKASAYKGGGVSTGSALPSLRSGDTLFGFRDIIALRQRLAACRNHHQDIRRAVRPLRPAPPAHRPQRHRPQRELLYGRYVRKSVDSRVGAFEGHSSIHQSRDEGEECPSPST